MLKFTDELKQIFKSTSFAAGVLTHINENNYQKEAKKLSATFNNILKNFTDKYREVDKYLRLHTISLQRFENKDQRIFNQIQGNMDKIQSLAEYPQISANQQYQELLNNWALLQEGEGQIVAQVQDIRNNIDQFVTSSNNAVKEAEKSTNKLLQQFRAYHWTAQVERDIEEFLNVMKKLGDLSVKIHNIDNKLKEAYTKYQAIFLEENKILKSTERLEQYLESLRQARIQSQPK